MAPDARPAGGTKRRGCVRRIGCALLVCMVLGAALVFWLVPWNPFAASAGPLAAVVPPDATAALRLDPRTVLHAPLVERLLEDAAFTETLDELSLPAPGDLDDETRALIDSALSLLGNDAVIAERDGEWLVAARIAGLGQAARLSVARGLARLTGAGVEESGDGTLGVSVGGGAQILLAHRRDVLFLASDDAFLADALALVETAAPRSGNEGLRDALGEGPLGSTVVGWVSAERSRDGRDWLTGRSEWFADLIDEVLPGGQGAETTARASLVPGGDAITLDLAWTYQGDPPPLLANAPHVAPEWLAESAERARRLAGGRETLLSGAAAVPVRDALSRLSLPRALRDSLVARGAALDGRVGFSVTSAGDPASDTETSALAVLPVRPAAGAVALDLLAQELEARDGVRGERFGPRSVRLYVTRRACIALDGDAVVVCDDEGRLRDALTAEPEPPPPLPLPPENSVLVFDAIPSRLAGGVREFAWIERIAGDLGIEGRAARVALRLSLR